MSLLDIIIEEKIKFFSNKMKGINEYKDIFTKLKLTIKLGMEFADKNPQINKFSQGFIKEFGTESQKKMNRYLRNRSDYLNNLIEKYNFVSID